LEKQVSFLIVLKENAVSVGKWIETHHAFVTATATIFIAAFTCALVWATLRLWRVSQKQSRDMETSLKIAKEAAQAAQESASLQKIAMISTQRAFIFMKEFQPFNNIDSTTNEIKQFIIEIKFLNYGKTPGLNVNAAVYIKFFDASVPNDNIVIAIPLPTETEKIKANVGPGGLFSANPIFISRQEANDIFLGKTRCFVMIAVEYNDWFNDTPLRHTNYFAEIVVFFDPEQASVNPNVSMFQLRSFWKYNSAD
jgi:hypothetical protein